MIELAEIVLEAGSFTLPLAQPVVAVPIVKLVSVAVRVERPEKSTDPTAPASLPPLSLRPT